jgi:hypothetical protein
LSAPLRRIDRVASGTSPELPCVGFAGGLAVKVGVGWVVRGNGTLRHNGSSCLSESSPAIADSRRWRKAAEFLQYPCADVAFPVRWILRSLLGSLALRSKQYPSKLVLGTTASRGRNRPLPLMQGLLFQGEVIKP